MATFDWAAVASIISGKLPEALADIEYTGNEVISDLARFSLPAAAAAKLVLDQILSNAEAVVLGKLDATDCKASLASLWESFRLVGLTLLGDSERAAYASAKALLSKLESLMLGMVPALLGVGLKGLVL